MEANQTQDQKIESLKKDIKSLIGTVCENMLHVDGVKLTKEDIEDFMEARHLHKAWELDNRENNSWDTKHLHVSFCYDFCVHTIYVAFEYRVSEMNMNNRHQTNSKTLFEREFATKKQAENFINKMFNSYLY